MGLSFLCITPWIPQDMKVVFFPSSQIFADSIIFTPSSSFKLVRGLLSSTVQISCTISVSCTHITSRTGTPAVSSLSPSSEVHSSSLRHNKVATLSSTLICLLAGNIVTEAVITDAQLAQTAGTHKGLSFSAGCLQGDPHFCSKVSATISFP